MKADSNRVSEQLLGPDAAACCVRAGLTDRALELFEQSHGVLLGQALDTRADLALLGERHPDLAHRFVVLRDELDRDNDLPGGLDPAFPETDAKANTQVRAHQGWQNILRRRETAEAFDRLSVEIRRIPGSCSETLFN